MLTSQSCWHLPNCSGKNEVQGLSLSPPSSITVRNRLLLFSHHSLSVVVISLLLTFACDFNWNVNFSS